MPAPTLSELNELRKLPHSWEPSQSPASNGVARYVSWRVSERSEIQQRARLLGLVAGVAGRALKESPRVERKPITDEQLVREEQIKKNQAAIALLQSWCDADEEEIQDQRETLEVLENAFGEDF